MAELLGHEAAALPADRDDGEPGRAARAQPSPAASSSRRSGRMSSLRVGAARRSTPASSCRAVRRRGRPVRPTPCSMIRRGDRRARAGQRASCSRTRTAAPAAGSGRSTRFGAAVEAARCRGAAVHLDGARLFNASVAAGIRPLDVGSTRRHGHALLLERARLPARRARCRLGGVDRAGAGAGKYLFGGAMRQSGIAAAAAFTRSTTTSSGSPTTTLRARRLAEGIGIDPATVETNFVPIPDEPGLRERLLRARTSASAAAPGLAARRHAPRYRRR